MAIDSVRQRIELIERLERYPELEALLEEAIDIVENTSGEVTKADEAEEQVVELMRRTGRDLLQSWAERKQRKIETESDKRSDLTRKEKKGSTGTQRWDE
jgi:hypothetical protein